MLGTSPLSVTYSFADIKDNKEKIMEKDGSILKNIQNEEFEVILTEKIVDGKLEVQHYALTNDISSEDRQRVYYENEISNWAHLNYDAYNSGIIIFDGKALSVEEDLWRISLNDVLNLEERYFDLKWNDKTKEFPSEQAESIPDGDLCYRVIFSGKIGGIGEEGAFVTFIMRLDFNNPEIGQNVKFSHILELVNSEKSKLEDNHHFVL